MAEDDVDLSFEALTFGDSAPPQKKPQKKDKSKKAPEPEDSGEPEKNCLLVSTNKFGEKLNFPALLKLVEPLGALKTSNFRENQCFGFLQFENDEEYEKALEFIHDLDIDGVKVTAERCMRVTPGRDPRTHDVQSEFKNTTLVLKNLPFNLKLEQLQELLNQQEFPPLNVAYLYDAAAMFRGMAFVKYREIDQARAVFEKINNMEIHGRKLRVEYKRTLKEGEGGEDDRKLLDQLTEFRTRAQVETLTLPGTSPDLSFHCPSSYQRKSLHQMAEKLGLVHYSTGEGDNQFVVVRFKDAQTKDAAKEASDPKGRDISSGRRSRTNSESHASKHTSHSLEVKGGTSWGGGGGGGFANGGGSVGSWSKSPKSPDDRNAGGFGSFTNKSRTNSLSAQQPHHVLSSSPGRDFKSPLSQSPGSAAGGFGGGFASMMSNTPPTGSSPSYRQSAAYLNRRASIKSNEAALATPTINIARQPKGPDGTGGFSPAYRTARSPSLSAGGSSPSVGSPSVSPAPSPGPVAPTPSPEPVSAQST